MTDRAVAYKLVRRTGFGATGPEVDKVVAMGADAYVQQLLATDPLADPGVAATPLPSYPDPGSDPNVHTTQIEALEAWWLRRLVAVQQPFGEKLTWVWHNHFPNNIYQIFYAQPAALQNQKFRTLGRGDFRTLAYTMLTDAGMILFLTGQSNVKGSANENLAREFMELFALGHGDGYTEQDVREGARALTGWQVNTSNWSTYLDPTRHDTGTKTVLGVTGNLGAGEFCDAVLNAPASPGFVASKLWSFLVSNTPPDAGTLSTLTAAYGPGRQLTPLFRAMFTCPGFGNAVNTMISSHVEWLVGAIRSLKVPVPDDTAAREIWGWLWWLGQQLFVPPSVGGYAKGRLWLTTAAVFPRVCIANTLASRANLSAITGTTTSRLEAAAYLLGIPTWSNDTAAALTQVAGNPQALVAMALISPENLTD